MSESIIEKALLEAEQLEETMKSNAKEILSSTMKEEINELVKESLSEGDDYLKEQEDPEQEVDMNIRPMGPMGMELDIEDETDDMNISAELPPLDLTSASDKEVLKVFKAMGSEDGIIVQQDDDEISLTDGNEEYLIKLEENKKTMKKEPMYEIEMDAEEELEEEPVYEIELDESGEHTHDPAGIPQSIPASGVMGVNAPESAEALADYENFGGELAEDEPEYEIELDEDEGMPGHHTHPEYQTKPGYEQGYDAREDESLGMRTGAEATKQVSMKGRRDDSYGAFGKRGTEHPGQGIHKQSEMGEASRTFGSGSKSGRGLRKGITNNRNYNYGKGNLQENYQRLQTEVGNLKGKNGEYRKALVSFKQKLNEVGVFNSNLAYATRLFTEHSTTKSEKVNILRRFDNVKSLKQSKDLYRVIREELSQNKPSITSKAKKSISESVNRRINSTLKSGSQTKLMETKAYENPQFTRIKDLMSKL
tara:strand:+ start:3491 stop:4927 length:1437 start_codon:yes stop_codon:yes gene_type:complete